MKRRLTRRALLCLLLALPGIALAQSGVEVEVVVFRQWEAGGGDAELSPANPPPPEAVRPVSLVGTGFSRLPPSELELAGVRQRLAESNAYEVLTHFGWTQPALSPEESRSVVIPAGWRPADGVPVNDPLFGSFRLIQRNYLHLKVDLRYRRPPTGELYTMIQEQRVPPDRLYYFDDPVLGVIVEVRPTQSD